MTSSTGLMGAGKTQTLSLGITTVSVKYGQGVLNLQVLLNSLGTGKKGKAFWMCGLVAVIICLPRNSSTEAYNPALWLSWCILSCFPSSFFGGVHYVGKTVLDFCQGKLWFDLCATSIYISEGDKDTWHLQIWWSDWVYLALPSEQHEIGF